MNGREFIARQLDLTANQVTYKSDVWDVLMFVNSPIDGVFVKAGYFESVFDAEEYADFVTSIYDNKYPDMKYACYVLGKCRKEKNLSAMLNAPANEANLIKK